VERLEDLEPYGEPDLSNLQMVLRTVKYHCQDHFIETNYEGTWDFGYPGDDLQEETVDYVKGQYFDVWQIGHPNLKVGHRFLKLKF
jgi:hypothetical protein